MLNNKIFYLRNKLGSPVGCVAWIQKGDTIFYTVSVCAKQDTFKKSLGRKIALDRLMIQSKVHKRMLTKISSNNIMREIMYDISAGNNRYRKSLPQQAIDSARHWVKNPIKG